MKIAYKLGYMALALMIWGGVSFTPAEAAYKPKLSDNMGGSFKKDVQGVVAYLKSLPKPARWTFMAEYLGVLYMAADGASGHTEKGGIDDGARFVGIDGREYDASGELKAVRVKGGWSEWEKNKFAIERLGRDAVFAKMSSEVTALVLANAKFHLKKMAESDPVLRDMCLANIAGLCYMPDGEKANAEVAEWNDPGRFKQVIRSYSYPGSKFVDAEGAEHDYDDVYAKLTSRCGHRWNILQLCNHYVGKKDILSIFPDDVKKLRANYEKKMKELKG